MTTYDVLVTHELLPEFTNDNPRMPDGFRILGPADGTTPAHAKRLRVEDDNAPAWTEGKLVSPVFINRYELDDQGRPTGDVAGTTVTGWIEERA